MEKKATLTLRNWLCFVRDFRWSQLKKRQLLRHYESVNAVYALSLFQQNQLGKKKISASELAQLQRSSERDIAWLFSNDNHHFITIEDKEYPPPLQQINDPPLALFAIGNIQCLFEPIVAIVGSRRPSAVGVKMAQKFATNLAQLGIVVCSGMALGIDGYSHQAALDEKMRTIAVVGCGVDQVYPQRHHMLYKQISTEGLLLSEYPLGQSVTRYAFAQRNRIISGLSLGVVIIEAAEKSGTLITARLAIEQNKDVFVLPGSALDPQYVGSHRLIQQGAYLTQRVEDILQSLSIPLGKYLVDNNKILAQSNVTIYKPITEIKRKILEHISFSPTSLDHIISHSGLSSQQVSSTLILLELDEWVMMDALGNYLRVK